jgi:hypothetical protein
MTSPIKRWQVLMMRTLLGQVWKQEIGEQPGIHLLWQRVAGVAWLSVCYNAVAQSATCGDTGGMLPA